MDPNLASRSEVVRVAVAELVDQKSGAVSDPASESVSMG
jgi:hypothetical protein